MELYDKKYVYFDWDKELEGKKGFFGDSINHIKQNIRDNRIMWFGEICHNVNTNTDYPFAFIDESGNSHCFRFCYYDPYYEFRKAYLEEKQIQYKAVDTGEWCDCFGYPSFFPNSEYRIKPEVYYVECDDTLGFVIITKRGEGHCYWTGTCDDCLTWIENHRHLEDIAKAYEKGKMIQFFDGVEWKDCWNPKVPKGSPLWEADVSYRVAPEKRVPFDTVQELITHWEGMNPGCTNRPKCAMPMIWVKHNRTNCIYLITGYDECDNEPVMVNNYWITLKDLFDCYRFINDSIIGKRNR